MAFKVGSSVMIPGGPKMKIVSFEEGGQKARCEGVEGGKPFVASFPVDKLVPFKRFSVVGKYKKPY